MKKPSLRWALLHQPLTPVPPQPPVPVSHSQKELMVPSVDDANKMSASREPLVRYDMVIKFLTIPAAIRRLTVPQKHKQFLVGHWPPGKKSLRHVATHGAQQVERLLVLHPFGHDSLPK